MRKIKETLSKQKKYSDAAKVLKEVNKLEKRENRKFMGARDEKIDT